MPDLLFVYGTLHPDRAPAEIASVVRLLCSDGPATIAGRCLDLGAYPGVIPSADPADRVQGELFRLPVPDILAELDDYEGFLPEHPETSLFLRVEVVATRPDGRATPCLVYLYRVPHRLPRPDREPPHEQLHRDP